VPKRALIRHCLDIRLGFDGVKPQVSARRLSGPLGVAVRAVLIFHDLRDGGLPKIHSMQRQPPRSITVVLLVKWSKARFMSVKDYMDPWRKGPKLQPEDCILQALSAMRKIICGLPLAAIDHILGIEPRG
jgi:hypothetical protein